MQVGNPVFNNVIDLIYSVYEYGWGHGMVSEDTHDVIVRECNYSAPRPWSETCQNALADADAEIDSSQFLNQYDVLVDVCLEGSGSAQRLKAWVSTSAHGPLCTYVVLFACWIDFQNRKFTHESVVQLWNAVLHVLQLYRFALSFKPFASIEPLNFVL